MTIRKGSEWGKPREAGTVDREVFSDAELAQLGYEQHLETQASGNDPTRLLRPSSGDVVRTLGVESERSQSDQIVFPFDLGLVRLDGGALLPFVAHVIARNRLWSGQFATIMNVGWQGSNYFGPRAHPNDALLDVTEGSLSFQQRLLARKRVTSGTHLPHPNLHTTRRASHRIEFERRTPIFVDGVAVGRHLTIEVEVVTDAFSVVA